MLQTLQKIITLLTADATLTAIVPANNIIVGPLDVVTEKQSELALPQINIRQLSESSRSVPRNTRDTSIQIDIWSRDSQLQLETIYERIIVDLNYLSTDEGTAHLFWSVLGGATDDYESDRRIWHRACTFTFWEQS